MTAIRDDADPDEDNNSLRRWEVRHGKRNTGTAATQFNLPANCRRGRKTPSLYCDWQPSL
jgi:hypothetical protein